MPVDIQVTRPEEFAWRKDAVGTIEWPAFKEGKVLHARSWEEAVLIVLREWLVKAENDLTAASQIIKMGKAATMDTICFHAQQCLEK